MLNTIIGKKMGQTQGFLSDGRRIPMTRISVSGNVVSQMKNVEKDGYEAVQIGFGENKKADKPTTGHAKKAGLKVTPRFFMESKVDKLEGIELGSAVNVEEILAAGDIVDVTGTSKGKGYAGVVKRHGFKGGPKTHGQSDRHRAPGSIGQSTTPGRVYKGKRMAGRMGVDQVTVKNLEVIELKDGEILVKGLIPGHINSIVSITKRGVNKKHMGLFQEVVEEEVADKVEEIGLSVEEQEAQRMEAEVKAKAEEIAEKEAEQVTAKADEAVKEKPSNASPKAAEGSSDGTPNEDKVSTDEVVAEDSPEAEETKGEAVVTEESEEKEEAKS